LPFFGKAGCLFCEKRGRSYKKEAMEDGKQVKLEQDQTLRDQYGRLLIYVWLEERMVNEMLLEQGLARVSVFPPDVKYVDTF
jgi:micrococcal nuclease